MLTNSAMVILHEVLEAAFMIGILLAMSRFLHQSAGWSLRALLFGAIGAAVYAYFLNPVSSAFNGTGQELVNATLQVIAYVALLVCVFIFAGRRKTQHILLPTVMTIAVACAISLEGSEVLVYVAGFVRAGNAVASASIGAIVGMCIGLSVGVLFYHLLLLSSSGRSQALVLALGALVGTGMVPQATRELIQANVLAAGPPRWDSSALLSEDSILGQVLYSLIGYESSPSGIELVVYAASLAAMVVAIVLGRKMGTQDVTI